MGMKKCGVLLFLGAILVISTACTVLTGKPETQAINQTFAGRDLIEIRTITSDCVIKQAPVESVNVSISARFRPKDSFKFDVVEADDRLILSENFVASSTSGSGEWVITVPVGVSLVFHSSSGSLQVEGFMGSLVAQTSSGRVTLTDCGDTFDVSTSSGHITATGVLISGQSNFSSSSGKVQVSLNRTLESNLTVSSSSGDAILDYGTNPVRGIVEMSARVGVGKIESPFKDYQEERFMSSSNQEYTKQVFSFGSSMPHVVTKTASGKAILRAK